MFKSLDSIASVVGIFMYLTISKFKQVLRFRKGLGKVSTTTLTCGGNRGHWYSSNFFAVRKKFPFRFKFKSVWLFIDKFLKIIIINITTYYFLLLHSKCL